MHPPHTFQHDREEWRTGRRTLQSGVMFFIPTSQTVESFKEPQDTSLPAASASPIDGSGLSWFEPAPPQNTRLLTGSAFPLNAHRLRQ